MWYSDEKITAVLGTQLPYLSGNEALSTVISLEKKALLSAFLSICIARHFKCYAMEL